MLGALYPRFQFVNFTVYLLPQWLNQIMPRLFRFRVGVGCDNAFGSSKIVQGKLCPPLSFVQFGQEYQRSIPVGSENLGSDKPLLHLFRVSVRFKRKTRHKHAVSGISLVCLFLNPRLRRDSNAESNQV